MFLPSSCLRLAEIEELRPHCIGFKQIDGMKAMVVNLSALQFVYINALKEMDTKMEELSNRVDTQFEEVSKLQMRECPQTPPSGSAALCDNVADAAVAGGKYEGMTVPALKTLATERGCKKKGVGWKLCCPPDGNKAAIIKALQRSAHDIAHVPEKHGAASSTCVTRIQCHVSTGHQKCHTGGGKKPLHVAV
jgi:hypothetical protein